MTTPRNPLTLRIITPMTLAPEDLQRRERLEQRLADAKATAGSRWLLHNYNPTVRPARSVD